MYKVGDIVKVISADVDEVYGKKRHYFEVGQEAKVVDIIGDNQYFECEGKGIFQYLELHEIELVEQTDKRFRVGDLVKVIGNGDKEVSVSHHFPKGITVTVIRDNGDDTFKVQYDGKLVVWGDFETDNLFQIVEGRHLELIRGVK